jgi:hypothetical protein
MSRLPASPARLAAMALRAVMLLAGDGHTNAVIVTMDPTFWY